MMHNISHSNTLPQVLDSVQCIHTVTLLNSWMPFCFWYLVRVEVGKIIQNLIWLKY